MLQINKNKYIKYKMKYLELKSGLSKSNSNSCPTENAKLNSRWNLPSNTVNRNSTWGQWTEYQKEFTSLNPKVENEFVNLLKIIAVIHQAFMHQDFVCRQRENPDGLELTDTIAQTWRPDRQPQDSFVTFSNTFGRGFNTPVGYVDEAAVRWEIPGPYPTFMDGAKTLVKAALGNMGIANVHYIKIPREHPHFHDYTFQVPCIDWVFNPREDGKIARLVEDANKLAKTAVLDAVNNDSGIITQIIQDWKTTKSKW